MSVDDVKTRILRKVDLASLIGERVVLQARSGQRTGCCPFHGEKTPSFYVYDDHYHCYGCKEHGDAISYVRKIEGMSFFDALRYLARKYGVEAPELDEAVGRLGAQRQDASLFKMMLDAQEFYTAILSSDAAEPAVAYLLGRGFTAETIKAYGFGMTPQEGYGLVKHLRAKGYREADLIACSLATTSTRDGRAFDFLRQRVTIPIHDGQGRIIAFGGRTLDGAQPKYLNSRDSKLFDKSHTLFGFDKARKVMRERGRVVLVEGYMDTLQLWQAGFPETVACLGTAFTEYHMKALDSAAAAVVVLLFDGDGAGQKATLGAVSVALTAPKTLVKAAALPAGDDPDDFVRKNGPEALEELIRTAPPLLDFAIRERVRTTQALGIPEMVQKEFVPWLARVPDKMQRSFLVARLSHWTGIPAAGLEGQIGEAVAGTAPAGRPQPARSQKPATVGSEEPGRKTPLPPLDLIAYDLFGHVFHAAAGEIDPQALAATVAAEVELGVEHTALFEELLACHAAGESPAAREIGAWTGAVDPQLASFLEVLKNKSKAFVCNDRSERIAKVLSSLQERRRKKTVSQLKIDLVRAAADPSRRDEVNQILRTIGELSRSPSA